jgi:S-adenosylmethionine synthetase
MAERRRTAESVTEGHPDKICDQISDRILDAILTRDRYARVACDALVSTGLVVVAGEVSTKSYVDITGEVRATLRDIGYADPCISFDYHSCAVIVMFEEQSQELAVAVDRKGAGDQGTIVGYATDEARGLPFEAELLPVPLVLAHALARRLAEVRRSGEVPNLFPDGKVLVAVKDVDGVPTAIERVVLCAHHRPDVKPGTLADALTERVARAVLDPTGLLTKETVIDVNPAGPFTRGGPAGNVGLTGRKGGSDTYGTEAHHGGSALSGKDPTKTDRAAAYMARYAAKNVVAAGLARRCEIELAYVIGRADPVSLEVNTFGTGRAPDEKLRGTLARVFDFSTAGMIEALDLRRPIYSATSVYGHFGRAESPWERTDRASALADAIGKG